MKSNYISFLLCVLLAITVQAQELYIDGGKSITTFKFKDVLSRELQDLQSTNLSYIDLGYRGRLFTESINFVAGAGINSYGAVGNDNFGNYLAWETTYASFYAGLDAELFTIGDFAFHLKGVIGPEAMLQGTQTLNNDVFDVLNEQDFDTPFIFIKGAASFEYSVAERTAIFFQYRFARGSQIRRNESGADLGYLSNDFGIGLIFKLKKKDSEENTTTDATATKK